MIAALVILGLLQTAPDPSWLSGLEWRCIGPFRGGRTVGASGIAEQPNTFVIGVNNGGVWKTNDAGRTWKPIFDDQPTGSIGDVAIAPSNPNVIYVGSGEGIQRPDLSTGNGMYKSIDAGKTWSFLGLGDAQQIGGLAVDPKDENCVYVAALGHPYGPNAERGVFRSPDGGKNWEKTLYIDEDTGAIQVTVDPNDSNVVYADLYEARQAPWENGQWQGPGSGLYKSFDRGKTWSKLGGGLPTFEQGLGRIGFTIAPSNSNVLYATLDGGLFRSNDAGATWTKTNSEGRLSSRISDFAEVKCDPRNPDIVYIADTSVYRSSDGGHEFTCIKGSPGGDDYHRIWINPLHPEIILLAADQGACVSVNGGETWSSWYNQPTAQFYHVTADNQNPYWVYGGQQESGSAGVCTRGNDGQITFREWHPAGGDEYGYIAPDPIDPRYVYGGRINRWDRVTGTVEDIRPKGKFRTLRTAPVVFSAVDKKTLYFAGNFLFKTTDHGETWQTISPDLSRTRYDVLPSIGKYAKPEMGTMPRRGVIYTVAPSYRDLKVIWCGTDDGLVWITRDGGKNWKDVTPPGITSWSKVSLMDAGHFDSGTAYAAINRIRCDDQRPHIYRTHDFGQTWQEIVSGLPIAPINVVREDPVRRGLLFCGSEVGVSYSLDDGNSWQSLRQNMPATSIRDLVVHDNDLAVATHGRGFWILDNISRLRDASFSGATSLFPIPTAYQFERNTNTDTPLPPEEPAGKNPPDGAIFDYYLAAEAQQVVIEVLDSAGKEVAHFDSRQPEKPVDPKSITVMKEWVRPPLRVGTLRGGHRFVWTMRKPASSRFGLPISAIWHDTPLGDGEFLPVGKYRVKLNVDGKVYEREFMAKPDPRKHRGKSGKPGEHRDDDEP